jgi:hypothetical protein
MSDRLRVLAGSLFSLALRIGGQICKNFSFKGTAEIMGKQHLARNASTIPASRDFLQSRMNRFAAWVRVCAGKTSQSF